MKPNLCETDRLVAFLNDTLSENDATELTEHLDTCDACARQLERLAASPERWKDVQVQLSRTVVWGGGTNLVAESEQPLPFTIRQVIGMLDPTDHPNSLGRLGTHEVAGVVGSGAMGVVLKAVDPTLDRVVALKVMNPTLAACGTARHRFAREAKAAAGVLHPNVIAIHSVSAEHELPYLVMPYISGTSLQQRMNRQGPLELVEILRIGSQIAAGLSAAHQKGLIHRDIKPSNVMLDEGVETAMITDFGLARTIDDATMTRTGSIAGTPEYMSPEQARGDSVEYASDIFSLGSLLYALCSGTRAFRAKTSFGVLRKITDEEPTPIRELNPDVPFWLCELIGRMHRKTPNARPSSTEVRQLLEQCLAHTYQPDQNPLPKTLARPKASIKTPYFSPLLIGVFTMTVALIAVSIAAVLPGNYFEGSTPEATFVHSISDESKDQPSVFKTLNLSFPKSETPGTLIVDINRGFIDVVGHEKPGIVMEILTPPGYEESNGSDDQLAVMFAPKYDLKTDPNKNTLKLDTYNQEFALNLRIKVPYKTNLSLDSYFDNINVRNVSGTIKTRSQHSDIRLLDVSGSASAYSYNGNFTVRFKELASNANLDFESYNGGVDLSLPPSVSANVAVSAGTGSYRTAFVVTSFDYKDRPDSIPAKAKRKAERYQFGTINGGGIPIRIESQKGVVSIRKNAEPMP